MKGNWVYAVMAGTLLLSSAGLRAQELPAGPPPGGPQVEGPIGPIGPHMELLGFGEMHPGKVVTGSPYSAVAVTETTQTLADGNKIDRKVEANVFRDSQGRTRRETTFSGAGPLANSEQARTVVMIHDPVAATAFILHPDQKTAEQMPSHRGGPKNGTNLQSRFETRVQDEIANGTLKKEDLGTQTINGMVAQGTRYTRTIPAGQVGNSAPILIVNEQWYSVDLQVVVKSTRTDPRMGVTTYTLTNVLRTEPAASLFAVPSGYAVTQAKGGHLGRRGPGGRAPADAPPQPPLE